MTASHTELLHSSSVLSMINLRVYPQDVCFERFTIWGMNKARSKSTEENFWISWLISFWSKRYEQLRSQNILFQKKCSFLIYILLSIFIGNMYVVAIPMIFMPFHYLLSQNNPLVFKFCIDFWGMFTAFCIDFSGFKNSFLLFSNYLVLQKKFFLYRSIVTSIKRYATSIWNDS